jgi:MFS family permease
MMAVVGTLSFNFQVLLPLFARFTWHGTAAAYALLTSAMGVGSVAGALASGARNRVSPALLAGASAVFGVASLAAAAAPTLPLQVAALVPLGAASVTFAAGVNSSLQLAAGPALRGRVMALYSVVFLGSTPIGAPLVGWLAGAVDPRASLALGGVAALGTAAWAVVAYPRAGAGQVLRPLERRGPTFQGQHGPVDGPRPAQRQLLRVAARARAAGAACAATAVRAAAPAMAAGRGDRGRDPGARRGHDRHGAPAHRRQGPS